MEEDKETKEYRGVVNFIGEIKALGAAGKFLSLGLRLDTDHPGVWHNITGFDRDEILKIIGDIKVDDRVLIKEQMKGNYYNIVEISKVERTEEDVQVQQQIQIIDKSDVQELINCINDATEIADLKFKELEWPYIIKPEDVVKIAVTLFINRQRKG